MANVFEKRAAPDKETVRLTSKMIDLGVGEGYTQGLCLGADEESYILVNVPFVVNAARER